MFGTTYQDHGESKAILELWTTTLTDFNSINQVNDTISYLIRILQGIFSLTGKDYYYELKTKTEE